jgi:hypothetical protein
MEPETTRIGPVRSQGLRDQGAELIVHVPSDDTAVLRSRIIGPRGGERAETIALDSHQRLQLSRILAGSDGFVVTPEALAAAWWTDSGDRTPWGELGPAQQGYVEAARDWLTAAASGEPTQTPLRVQREQRRAAGEA